METLTDPVKWESDSRINGSVYCLYKPEKRVFSMVTSKNFQYLLLLMRYILVSHGPLDRQRILNIDRGPKIQGHAKN